MTAALGLANMCLPSVSRAYDSFSRRAQNELLLTLEDRGCFFGFEFGQCHGQITGQSLPSGYGFNRRTAFPGIVQLQEAKSFIAGTQGQQCDRFIPFAVAAIACSSLSGFFCGACQELRCAVGPKAATRREKRLRWVEAAADDVPAHALQYGVSVAIPD